MKVNYFYSQRDLSLLVLNDLANKGVAIVGGKAEFSIQETADGGVQLSVDLEYDAPDCADCDEDDGDEEIEIHAYEIPLESEGKDVDQAFAKILERVKADIARRKANRLEEPRKGKRH